MRKYKQCYQEMIDANKKLFTEFAKIHDEYITDSKKWQQEFNETGGKVQEVMRKYERILCSHSEAGKYGRYSATLAEKFKDEIRKDFPRIDFIGVIES